MFAFDRDETATDGLRRVAGECLEAALVELALDGDLHGHVHQSRKRLKELRALLRVGRGALPAKRRKALDGRLRDAGRALSSARDAEVRLKTFDALVPEPDATSVAIREGLVRARAADASALVAGDTVGAVRGELSALLAALPGWWTDDGGWSSLAPGLRWIYASGQQRMRQARSIGGDTDYHDWRKRVKDRLYATRLLAPAWQTVYGVEEAELHALSELLGNEHDLAVLAAQINGDPAIRSAAAASGAQLRARALWLGARLYAETPSAWLRRQRALWKIWRA